MIISRLSCSQPPSPTGQEFVRNQENRHSLRVFSTRGRSTSPQNSIISRLFEGLWSSTGFFNRDIKETI